jgi:hypothetical protein
MRRVALLPAVAILLAGCGAAGPLAVPPVVDLPVPPAPAASKAMVAAATTTPSAAPSTQPAPWVERAERTEVTMAVGRCQITPFTFGSAIAVENRLLDGGRLAMRVVQDDETAKEVTALPALLGKGYVIEASGQGLQVHGADDAPVPDDHASRVRALAATFLGWPGGDVAAHRPPAGAEVPTLEAPVVAVAGVPLHGAQVEPASKAVVVFTGARHGDAGDELVFDVTLKATASDAGMCHRWTNAADVKGELRLRASNGAFLGMHLEGSTEDTEGLCQDPSGKPGPPPPPHTCNRGKVTVEVKQPRVP